MCDAGTPCAQLVDVRASRARIVQASDAERRRLERALHDGPQQRLLAVGMRLQLLQKLVAGPVEELRLELVAAERELARALAELRDLASRLSPARLRESGLAGALDELAARSRLRVSVTCPSTRFTDGLESTGYLLVREAVTHAEEDRRATAVDVLVVADDAGLRVEVSDDSCLGHVLPHPPLLALRDRFAALDGALRVGSTDAGALWVVGLLPFATAAPLKQ